ncbi:hypothetical protein [Symbioplanes lichenis]|uniref:hypothetical protein n=1 Tax=Symbioplanes lichenis TaxID=1629072 RepID=UPI002738A005|nr:hypothetical protein [Actinoplanes lichenis]
MPTLVQRLQKFLASPQGQKVVAEGRRQLAKPENQAKLKQLATRFQSRRPR